MINGWEWVIILVVVLLVFGVGRISKLGSELGKGISAFREGLQEGQADKAEKEDEKSEADANI
ncbi:MAG: twin-arginine translocase TatA/TatE family subunit [Anaerolineae bacterium]